MRVLHITDLHITDATTSLIDLWAGLQPAIEPTVKIDFAVVSGDLVQAANPRSYRAVRDFLKGEILPRLTTADVHRIVIVPGNHDVDWTSPAGHRVDHQALSPDELATVDAYLRDPASYIDGLSEPQWRVALGRGGIQELYRVDRDMYPKRFQAFQSFVDDFYGVKADEERSRMFDLRSTDESNHWSAHVFDDEQVAFYGFSSCHHNDRLWRGACVNPKAVTAASQHARNHADKYLRIAVFHHGFSSRRGDADHLTAAELGRFANARFHIGMHGHTHQDEFTDGSYELRRRFPVIATGSFAAGARERPDGERNQASLLDLSRNFIRWRLLARSRNEQWEARSPKTYLLPSRDRQGEVDHAVDRCMLHDHVRTVTVDADGIATIEITMIGAEFDGELLLAAPTRSASAIAAEATAEFVNKNSRNHRKIVRRDTRDGPAFVLTGNGEHADKINFRYYTSNSFALDHVDLTQMQRPSFAGELGLREDEDAWVYVVRTTTKRLALTVEYPEGYVLREPAARAQEHLGTGILQAPDAHWRDNHWESEHIQCTSGERTASLQVKNPRAGCRYALTYRLSRVRSRDVLDPSAEHLLRELLEECQSRNDSTLRNFLTDRVGGAIYRTFDVKQQAQDSWVAHLWNADSARLEAAFGNFASSQWRPTFLYGEGVVGHAFRRRGPAVYLRREQKGPPSPQQSSLIYRVVPSETHRWVVCVPLLLGPTFEFSPVGVLGFAIGQTQATTPLQKRLEFLATTSASARPARTRTVPKSRQVADDLSQLSVQTSYILWESLVRVLEGELGRGRLMREHQQFVQSVLDDHWRAHSHNDDRRTISQSDVAPRPDASPVPDDDKGSSTA